MNRSTQEQTKLLLSRGWLDDIENVIRRLKDKGVTFEHYDIPDMTRQGDVHVGGNMKVAWFKDLDGNLLNLR
jgi:hypothetical protein